MKRSHELANGKRVEYEATAEVVKFIDRLKKMVDDDGVSNGEFVAVAYSRANPILNSDLHPERGFVTPEVLKDPAYKVVQDLLFRKEENQRSVKRKAATYTLTVTEAASRLGMSPAAVRKAIDAGRLTSWVHDGIVHLSPDELDRLDVGTRTPTKRQSVSGGPLEVSVGHEPGSSLRIAGFDLSGLQRSKGNVLHGRIDPGWRELVVVVSGEGGYRRAFRLVPATKESEIEHHSFFVRGRFTIAETANSPVKANAMWKAASASSA